MKKLFVLTTLASGVLMAQANANTQSFSVAALATSKNVNMISIKSDVQYDCNATSCQSSMNETEEGLPTKYIPGILPAYSFHKLNPNHNNFIQFGYYNLKTGKSVFPTSCLININRFPADAATVYLDQTGCKISQG